MEDIDSSEFLNEEKYCWGIWDLEMLSIITELLSIIAVIWVILVCMSLTGERVWNRASVKIIDYIWIKLFRKEYGIINEDDP